MKNTLKSYNSCIVRTPLYSINNVRSLIISEILEDHIFMEAVRIASPILYNEVFVKKKLSPHSINSILKYYSRACTRCTPYGLFAACSLVPIDENKEDSKIELTGIDEYKTYSRIDMNLLCSLIRNYEKDPTVKQKLLYHTNSSLYSLWKSYRYITYTISNSKRHYMFSEIKKTPYLGRLLRKINNNEMSFLDIVDFIEKKESVDFSDAFEYTDSLIENQILISNLEPSVAGKDLIYQIIDELERVKVDSSFLNQINSILRQIDNEKIGTRKYSLDELDKILSIQNPDLSIGNPVHMDCYACLSNGYIGENLIRTVKKAITFLINFTRKSDKNDLDTFKQKFYSYYEEQEIPLAIALDPQIGVGYGQWNDINGDINPILDGVPSIKEKSNGYYITKKISIDFLSNILMDKYNECIINNSDVIDLSNLAKELEDEIIGEVPNQVFAFLSVVSNKKTPTINLIGIGTGTCSKLISRFEYLNSDIKDFVDEITTEEQDHQKEIIAEILHLPEDRVGNIQMHPNNREYSICYFSNPVTKNIKEKIPISDLMISVPRGEKIVLRSKKYNKEIKPILSTAHNFYLGLPIYRFLGDLQIQDNDDFAFSWGELFENKPFLPRVQFDNIILSPARWLITIDKFKNIEKINKEEALRVLKEKLLEYKIPQEFVLSEGDNKLYINTNEYNLLYMLLIELIHKRTIKLEEFLGSDSIDSLVTRNGEMLDNEIIMCFHK